ncbi:MAG: prolyl oligopeptidase family serine peptidase [Myxococcota bacterium]|nr:prolyl oligopeptidase family serine peptidase [Myxococcota bacterium]
MNRSSVLVSLVCFTVGCAAKQGVTSALDYPESRKGDVVDVHHGVQVPDPYRWLEEPQSEESQSWITQQNALTHGWLDEIEERARIRDRVETLWNYERYSSPSYSAGRYFYFRNDGLQNQSVLYVTDSLDEDGEVLLDPNSFSEDGTVSLAGWYPSDTGQYMAYGTSDGGSDWRKLHVLNLETGETLEETLEWVKFSRASWNHEGTGFYYSRYPEPEQALQDINAKHQVYFHAVGTPQSEDVLLFETPENPDEFHWMWESEDGEAHFMSHSDSTDDRNRLWWKPVDSEEWRRLFDENDAGYRVLGKKENTIWIRTNKDAPNGRVFSLDLERPEQQTLVIAERENVLEGISLVGGRLVAQYLEDAQSRVEVFELDGTPVGQVELPGVGSASGWSGKIDQQETFFTFSSFTAPPTIYRFDMATLESTKFRSSAVDFDPAAYTAKQVFYTSQDGTQIPMFIVHKEGIELDGSHPALLYGYGGFNISLTPWFAASRVPWLEMGGIYAVANLRGGGEYGEEWHKAGTKLNKQNVFDDFIAAAEYLQAQGYTRPDRLAIQGSSNGGLLVGATLLQRPELFGAALPGVGVLDMLRYHLFTIGRHWSGDYGTAENAEEFAALYAYSPVHNAAPDVAYPATMITTGDHDDRVVPAHSFKFAAALQAAQAGDAPILIRVETRGGHGAGKPTQMRIDQTADTYSFLFRALNMELPENFEGQ